MGDSKRVEVIGMIGVKREAAGSSGVALSVIGGGADPGDSIPLGIDTDYIVEFSRAHEEAGFDKVLIGYASTTADGFLVAAHAAANTEKLGYLIAHRPGVMSPTLAARKMATLDHMTSGRIAVHFISGGSDQDQRRDGDWLDHDSRYRRTDEYLEVLKRLWTEDAPFDYEGEFYKFAEAFTDVRCLQEPHLPVYFGGASETALDVGSRRADVFALWGEPVAALKAQIARIDERAKVYDRRLQYSVSVRPIIADTETEAWDKAYAILEGVKRNVGGKVAPGASARPQSVGSWRLVDLANEGEILDKRLWTAIAHASGAPGSSTALVGTAEQVVDSLLDYYDIGCTKFIIRGFDPLHDTEDYGRELIPMLKNAVASRPQA